MKFLATLILFVTIAHSSFSQIGGRSIYEFLSVAPSARIAALGGTQIAVMDDELTLGVQNPALLNGEMHQQASFNQIDYLSDIAFGFAGYGHKLSETSTLMVGVQYVSYGDFIQTDEFGTILGNFSGNEEAFVVGYGKTWKYNLSFGANMKFIYSNLAGYTSSGLVFDFGLTHHLEDKQITSSFVIRNLGFSISNYANEKENAPLDIQMGISKKLENAPFRFNLSFHQLNRPNMTYSNPFGSTIINLETGQPQDEKTPLSDKIMRHVVIGTEILFGENFSIRGGYNHQMRKELTIEQLKGGVGYSWGFGLKIWRFKLDYARVSYHLSGASNFFSIASNLGSWVKKDKVIPSDIKE